MNAAAKWHIQADRLALTGEVDFTNVVALLREAENGLKNSSAPQCVLDLSGVVNSNSAAIALIMSLHRRAHVQEKNLVLVGVPDNLVSMARLGSLDWLLGGQSDIPVTDVARL